MPTGDKHVDIYNKQLVPQTGWDQYFFRYLDGKVDAATRSAFLSAGVLSDQLIGLTSTANDTWEVDITNASRGVDDTGHIMDLSLAETDEVQDIAFENANGITYYTGFRFQEVPNGIERNTRSTEAEYPWALDTIGELGDPDNVTDLTTSIRLEIDGILEAGVDHKNRPVRVWLDNPVSPVLAVAYYDGLVEYDGTNFVSIPYTVSAGPLGQTAPTFPISTTASDYTVHVRGLSWFRNTDISTDGNYVFLGTVQGSGAGTTPTVFDTNGQNSAFLISLQRAYYGNSSDDPAPGRSIWAHRGAVKIRQSGSTVYDQDLANAALWIDKQDEAQTISTGVLKLFAENSNNISLPELNLRSLNDGVGNDLQKIEAATISGNTITLTRVGVDLDQFPNFFRTIMFVLVENSTNNLQDGLYVVTGTNPTSTTVNVVDLDINVPTWPVDGCQVRFFYGIDINFHGAPLSSTYSDFPKPVKTIPQANDGPQWSMIGNPLGDNKFFSVGAIDQDKANLFFNLVAGRIWMYGGGTRVNTERMEGTVRGTGVFQVDKRMTGELGADWVPDEASGEWGFDYRGNDFGKAGISQFPGYQLAASFRQPLSVYDGGSNPLIAEEPFTVYNSNTIDLTRSGVDNAAIPAYSQAGGGTSWVIVEIEFDTPTPTEDGIYTVYAKSGGTLVSLVDLSGATPNLTVSTTGTARFYGGSFFGTYNSYYGGQFGWSQTIVPPTDGAGGLRMIFNGEDNIASTEYRYASLIHGYGDNLEMWGVRDGGVMFGRAITTRGWEAGHELTQWDEIDTALVNCDNIVSDLATITEIDLDNSPVKNRYIAIDQMNDFVYFKGGGTSGSYGRAQSMFPGIGERASSGSHYFELASDLRGIHAQVPTGEQVRYAFKVNLTQNCTLNTVQIRGVPGIGDGTANAMGFTLYRQDHQSSSTAQTMGTLVRWTGGNGVTQTVTFTVTSGNQINNGIYDYYVVLESSAPTGATIDDYWYWCSTFQTVTGVGHNLFLGD